MDGCLSFSAAETLEKPRFAGQMWLCDFGAPLEVQPRGGWVLFQPSDSLQDCPSSPSCTGPGGTQACASGCLLRSWHSDGMSCACTPFWGN